MDDRERPQWLLSRAPRERATAWGIMLLHTVPLLVACLLALALGRPGIAAGALALVLLALGLVHTLTRPRRFPVASAARGAPGRLSRSH